ncbi:WD SAM and U-box domain-containing 1 isoform X3 [Labeo rohita]|uniref:WD repeat, SAM and U-box domain-containing protein 1 n=1 Tax=Labeo rohita TaxID=84645 RepID=A0A498P2K2_LABRO|nr:WD SAM and U-box domain-containing 1 isoform X3 [Labeo rohita]
MASLLCTLQDHRDDVNCCALSDRLLASCSGDKTVRVYSCEDFRELPFSPLRAHAYGVHCCCFSSCGRYLASCSTDALTIHNKKGYEMLLLYTLTAQSAPVLCCALSFDGQLLVSGSVDKTVTVYDANHGELLHTLTQHDRYVTACAFSPCTLMFASGSMDKTVNIWRIGDGNAEASEPLKTSVQGRKSLGYSRTLVSDWSEEDVSEWLRDEGFEALVDTFRAHNIDGAELINLNTEVLTTEFNIESVGLRGQILRKIKDLRSSLIDSDVPDEFLCPITRELMKDPVIAADGFSYEREAMESWISTPNRSSPMTNLPLQTMILTPNRSLKTAIQRWKSSH